MIALILLTILGQTHAQEYGGDALRVGLGARALGMGSAYVAVSDGATSLYWNPAGLAHVRRPEIHAQHAERFGGSVNHDNLVFAAPTSVGSFAAGLVRVGVDGINLSGLEDPSLPLSPGNRPVATSSASTSDYTLTIGYGRSLREDLSLGATIKMVWRNLETGDGTGYGIDLGLRYAVRDDWTIGVVARDATRTRITFDSGAKDSVSPSLHLGASYDREIPEASGRIIIAAAFLLNDDVSSVGGAQRGRAGIEYRHRSGVSGRLGLEGENFTAGAGIEPADRIRVDVAFLQHGDLDNTYRLSASLYF